MNRDASTKPKYPFCDKYSSGFSPEGNGWAGGKGRGRPLPNALIVSALPTVDCISSAYREARYRVLHLMGVRFTLWGRYPKCGVRFGPEAACGIPVGRPLGGVPAYRSLLISDLGYPRRPISRNLPILHGRYATGRGALLSDIQDRLGRRKALKWYDTRPAASPFIGAIGQRYLSYISS